MDRNVSMLNQRLAVILSLMVAVPLTIHSGNATIGEWHFNKIDSCGYEAHYFDSRIRLDSGGRPQVIFQREWNAEFGLEHTRLEGDTCKIQAIEDNGSFFHIHFALDGNDHPHVLYPVFNRKDEGLKYACTDGKKWEKTTVYDKDISKEEMLKRFGCSSCSLNLMVSDSNDLAVDKDAGVHIVYADPELERVVYGYRPQGAKNWVLEPLEKAGNHRLTVSRFEPVVRVSPAGEVWIIYKRYTENKTGDGDKTVRIELRLAVKTGQEWKYSTITDRLGFIDGQSQILLSKAGECFVAYTVGAASRYNEPSTKWLLVQLNQGQWVQRYEGEPREQLLTAARVGDHFEMLMTRVRPDRPADGTSLQDNLVRLSASADWKWNTENLLKLNNRRALDAAMNQNGDAHVLFASSSATLSTLECGILKAAEANRQKGNPAEETKLRR